MRLPVLFILITVMLDAMGLGLIMPIMPDLLREVQGATLSQAALWGGVLSASFAVMQFLFGPIVGSLSDAYGRRPVLLVSLFTMALDYLVMALAGSIWLLLIARLVGGITAATHSTASAYMADISTPEQKSANFGLIGAAFGVGFVLGPLIGGALGEFGTRAPFYAAAVLAALNFVFGAVIMRETVTERIRRPFAWKRANPLGALRHISALPGLGMLLAAYFVYSVALYVYPAIWSYFTQARFDWSPGTIGLSLGIYGTSAALVQAVLIRFLIAYVGERRTVIYGLIFDMVACLALAIVTSGTVALILTPMAALGAVVTPALQGVMSRRTTDDAQGELQGVLASIHALAVIVSPLMMTGVFAAFTRSSAPIVFPGAPFVLATVLLGIALVLFARARLSAELNSAE